MNAYECTWKEIHTTQSLKQHSRFILYQFSDRTADLGGRAVWGIGLRPLDHWDRGFKPVQSMKVRLMCLLCSVYVEVSATGWSLTQNFRLWEASQPVPSWVTAPLKDELKPRGFVWWNLEYRKFRARWIQATGHWLCDASMWPCELKGTLICDTVQMCYRSNSTKPHGVTSQKRYNYDTKPWKMFPYFSLLQRTGQDTTFFHAWEVLMEMHDIQNSIIIMLAKCQNPH